MKVFNIDYDRLLLLLLPTFLRKLGIVSLLQSATVALKSTYGNFSNNQISNLYKLVHNGQVCYLKKVLNDTFDPDLRRIKIIDGNKYTRQFIFSGAEQFPSYLGTMHLKQYSDYADTGVDFRVTFPAGYPLAPSIYQISATIEYYKLASKRYKIQYENE